MTWEFPLYPADLTNHERLTSEQGAFGYKRSYYYHQGVDLYVQDPATVKAVEDGVVVAIEDFTGPPAGHDHWLYTQAVLVEGESGVVCYGEVKPFEYVEVGLKIKKGENFACVAPVLLPGMERPDIPGHSRWMLHFELYKHGTRETARWHHDDLQDPNLLDPTEKLTEAWEAMLRKRYVIGFTGTRNGMTQQQRNLIITLIKVARMKAKHLVVGLHGDCVGADADFDELCKKAGIETWSRPCNYPNMRAYTKSKQIAEVTNPMARNREIVKQCSVLLACPPTEEELEKGGTWKTIRMGRKRQRRDKDLNIYIVYPKGAMSAETVEGS